MEKKIRSKPAEKEAAALYFYSVVQNNSYRLRMCHFPMKDQLPDGAILQDGTEVRLVPMDLTKGKVLYVSRNGKGYSYREGQFRNILPEHLHSTTHYKNAEKYVRFSNFGKILVHRAVLSAWVGPRPEGYECDHINGDPNDNRVENLDWVTKQENVRRRWLNHSAKGESYSGKRITELGKRTLRRRKARAEKYGVSIELALGATLLEIK